MRHSLQDLLFVPSTEFKDKTTGPHLKPRFFDPMWLILHELNGVYCCQRAHGFFDVGNDGDSDIDSGAVETSILVCGLGARVNSIVWSSSMLLLTL